MWFIFAINLLVDRTIMKGKLEVGVVHSAPRLLCLLWASHGFLTEGYMVLAVCFANNICSPRLGFGKHTWKRFNTYLIDFFSPNPSQIPTLCRISTICWEDRKNTTYCPYFFGCISWIHICCFSLCLEVSSKNSLFSYQFNFILFDILLISMFE